MWYYVIVDGSLVMIDNDCTKENRTTLDFSVASVHHNQTVVELVRHLARISAENDYKAFLKTVENRYSGGLKKGPPQ